MPEPKKPSEEPGEKTLTTTASAAAAGDPAAKPADKATGAEKPDDPEPEAKLWDMKKQRALADASKPIEAAAESIWSQDPDKRKARKAIEDAYAKAAKKGTDDDLDSHGELRARYERVNAKFIDAAADMLRSRQGPVRGKEETRPSHLARWIESRLTAREGEVRKVLLERKQVGARLATRLGEREARRLEAADTTKRWEQAFGRWSSPDKEIAALIASYADRIDQLNADINTGNNRDQAIFSFWFEVAPVHLQLRDKAVTDANAPGVERIIAALTDFDADLSVNFQSGAERKNGSIYLIEPGQLPAKREEILVAWQEAADKQAIAEADYATRPDAAADLKPRHDKLRDDSWVKGTRELLAAPKP